MRLRPPPSTVTGELGTWLAEVHRVLADTPNVSYWSGETPNSNVTGIAGDLLVNVGSASTNTRIWLKTGSVSVPSKLDWVTLTLGPP